MRESSLDDGNFIQRWTKPGETLFPPSAARACTDSLRSRHQEERQTVTFRYKLCRQWGTCVGLLARVSIAWCYIL